MLGLDDVNNYRYLQTSRSSSDVLYLSSPSSIGLNAHGKPNENNSVVRCQGSTGPSSMMASQDPVEMQRHKNLDHIKRRALQYRSQMSTASNTVRMNALTFDQRQRCPHLARCGAYGNRALTRPLVVASREFPATHVES